MRADGARPPRHRETALERRARRAAVDDPEVVMDAAAAFLALRPRSVAETRRRLQVRGYAADLVEQVLDRLIRVGYLDDRAFARAWVESRDRARPRGSLALRRELAQKGVAREVVDEVLGERAESHASPEVTGHGGDVEADELSARRLLERRMSVLEREAEPRRRRQKAYALLARHGFPPDVCRQAVASVVGASGSDADEDTRDEGV